MTDDDFMNPEYNHHADIITLLQHSDKSDTVALINDDITNINLLYEWAYTNGTVDDLKFVLHSPELNKHADVHYKGDRVLYTCVQRDNIDILRYVLTSPEIVQHGNCPPDIHEHKTIQNALLFGHINSVQFLLTAPELLVPNANGYVIGHASLEDLENVAVFKKTCDNYQMLQYLVFDYQMEVTPGIQKLLNDETVNSEPMKKLLKLRDLNCQLNHDLPVKIAPKKIKI